MPNYHECDLFLFSSFQPYTVNRSLKNFARLGERNINGWGIGYYSNGESKVVRSNRRALDDYETISDGFTYSCDVIESNVVLGHLRLSSAGDNRVQNNHPFKLHFLDYDWLFIHNGTARNRELVNRNDRVILDSNNDSPRVFEFLSFKIMEYLEETPKRSLIEAVRYAFSSLLEEDSDGSFNIVLTNGNLSFVLIHWRPFYLYKNEKGRGNTLRLSTLPVDRHDQRSSEQLVF